MGNPKIVWSLVQLRLENQLKVLLVGWLPRVSVEVEGHKMYSYFEVIHIFDGTNLYLYILVIDWSIENHTINKFKNHIMSFQDPEMRLVEPLNPMEGQRYVEPV